MEIPGLSYLKYADATQQGLNRNIKAQHVFQCQIVRSFKELQPGIPSETAYDFPVV
ncbi:hypothetical protein SAMN05216311_101413 [Chitinophaga sp. CF418]|nr:hypothetical protein SAMN05216311_101413 [Chitinophaga sp. CF418]